MSKKQKRTQIDTSNLPSALKRIVCLEFAWANGGYKPDEQTALLDWARRVEAGEDVETYQECLAAVAKQRVIARPIPDAAQAIEPNTVEDDEVDWATKDPTLHERIHKTYDKLRHTRAEHKGYTIYNSLIVPHVFIRGSRKAKNNPIRQPFGLRGDKEKGTLGSREFAMLVTLITICVGRDEGNELTTYPAELRAVMRRKYCSGTINKSMWEAVDKLQKAGYIDSCKQLNNNKTWRIVINRDQLVSWLRDQKAKRDKEADHAYQLISAVKFYEASRSPLWQWAYCAFGTSFTYTGRYEALLRSAAGSRATLANFRRSMRRVFKRAAINKASAQIQQGPSTTPDMVLAVHAETKQLIAKAAQKIWQRGKIGNAKIKWKLDLDYWFGVLKNIDSIVLEAVNSVFGRLYPDLAVAGA